MAEERVQRRLAAILAADVVGYSRLMEQDEAGTMAILKARRKEVLEPLVARRHGRIFKVAGDGVFIEFGSAVDAVECAVDLQRDMSAANGDSPDARRILLRIGVNLGDVMIEGSDLYGDGVNIAARLEALAEPGAVIVARTVFNHVRGKVKLGFDDLGEQQLKNIAEPVHIYRLQPHNEAVMTGPSPTLPDKPSIAVLPFENMSGDPEQQYFSDGITEDIITELARYRSLLVIARNSCFQFRGSAADVTAVRRKLGVSYIVEGSVRKAGSRVRVTAQLIDAVSQSHIWAERYDREPRDIFAIQDEVTHAVVAALEGRIAASGAEQSRHKPSRDWKAYDYFLKGRECFHRYEMVEAELFFARAIELDPAYVHAHAWFAMSQGFKYLLDEQAKTLQTALASAHKALALDDTDPWAHQAMGYVALRQHQWELAGQHFARALGLNANDTGIVGDYTNWLMCVGRLEDAISSIDAAMQRDPYPPTWLWEVRGQTLYFLKRYDEAIIAFRNVRAEHVWMSMFLAASYALAGNAENARSELASFLKNNPEKTVGFVSSRLNYADQVLRDHLLEGLRKAGLPE
jgi:TolB-like protein